IVKWHCSGLTYGITNAINPELVQEVLRKLELARRNAKGLVLAGGDKFFSMRITPPPPAPIRSTIYEGLLHCFQSDDSEHLYFAHTDCQCHQGPRDIRRNGNCPSHEFPGRSRGQDIIWVKRNQARGHGALSCRIGAVEHG